MFLGPKVCIGVTLVLVAPFLLYEALTLAAIALGFFLILRD